MPSDYINGLIGGALIGFSGVGMLLFVGRVMGVSGILGGLLRPRRGEISWRLQFLVGILLGGLLLPVLGMGSQFEVSRSMLQVALGGFLVGFGTLLGNGCTSGHGVCGISRLSPRSLIATCTFIFAGMGMVFLLRG